MKKYPEKPNENNRRASQNFLNTEAMQLASLMEIQDSKTAFFLKDMFTLESYCYWNQTKRNKI